MHCRAFWLAGCLPACLPAQQRAGQRRGQRSAAPRHERDASRHACAAQAHPTIVTSVIMSCGPSTASGAVQGAMLPSCSRAIPSLAKMGIESELWLGETDSFENGLRLFNSTAATVATLVKLGRQARAPACQLSIR